jgi:hypothetical protein
MNVPLLVQWFRCRLTDVADAHRTRSERGQATAEHALVIIGAVTIAGLLIAWASSSGSIGRLFDSAIDRVTQLAQ